jgi:hypothetical protein
VIVGVSTGVYVVAVLALWAALVMAARSDRLFAHDALEPFLGSRSSPMSSAPPKRTRLQPDSTGWLRARRSAHG